MGSDPGDATYTHGLTLALSNDTKQWCPAGKKCLDSQYTTVAEAKGDLAGIANTDVLVGTTPHSHGDNAAKAARGYNSGTHPDGTSEWFLPSAGQWNKMITTAGGGAELRTKAGLASDGYWSSTESSLVAHRAWYYNFSSNNWYNGAKTDEKHVRACLAF